MIIKDPRLFEFKFSEEERNTIEKTIAILEELYETMENNCYDNLITGYRDCPSAYSPTDIADISKDLSEIATAWEVARDETD